MDKSSSLFCDDTEISILIINIQFILQNIIILSVSSLLLSIFLTTAGITEATPTYVLQSYGSKDNDSFLWLGELENPKPDREESGFGDEKFLQQELYTADDNAIEEGLERLEESTMPDLQETGIQDETSAGAKVTQVSRTTRNAGNACVQRYVHRSIYNWVFKIPVCKQGCKSKFRTVNFSNNKTLAIAYDCYI